MFDLPFPESLPTISAQLALLRLGRKPLVLLPTTQPGAEVPPGFHTAATLAGTLVAASAEKLAEGKLAVENNTLGIALGYGIPRKPEDADRVVFMHDGEGREIVAVCVNGKTEEAARASLELMAGADFRVGLVSPLFVIRQRLAFWTAFFSDTTEPEGNK